LPVRDSQSVERVSCNRSGSAASPNSK
jgi:hypothetical protein